MSFHPLMMYDERFHKSERAIGDEGPPFTFTPERRADARRDPHEVSARPQALGGARGALPGAGAVRLHDRRTACATSPGSSDLTPAEVEDVASYYVMFYRAPVGKYVLQVCRTLSCALLGAERVTEALAEKLGHQRRRD